MGRASNARQRLMDAVMELIWENSYGAVTIEAICDKAGVKKGSFYYFFDSKSDLAAAALKSSWDDRKPAMDALFSPTTPPLERFLKFFQGVYKRQVEIKRTCGQVLGCPIFTLGSEVCTQDPKLVKTIEQLLKNYIHYFENAIRDAHARKLISAPDAACKARLLFAYFEGALTQARIQNDPGLLKELPQRAMELLGYETRVRAA